MNQSISVTRRPINCSSPVVDGIWLILLFLGFGVVFLTPSYYFRSLWEPGAKAATPTATKTGSESSDHPPDR